MPTMKFVKSIVTTMVALAAFCTFVSTATAQTKVKTLFTWTGGGGNPEGNLIFDSAGNLYGTTADGNTIFELSPNSDGTWTPNVLWATAFSTDPSNMRPGVLFGADGNLYTTSYLGGVRGCGTVFKLIHNTDGTWTESSLLDFDCGSGGANPVSGVTFDKAGNLYGGTTLGGNFGNGVIFQLSPNSDGSWTEKVIHHFTGGTDGAYPDHQVLVFDSSGNLYGTASLGGQGVCPFFVGTDACGTVYKLTPQANGSWAFTAIHSFTGGADGGNPEATLVFDKSGNLYGTTYGGGQYGFGVAFKLIPHANGKWGEQVLHAFKSGGDGAKPIGGLIFDAAGNLYGTTNFGGNNQCGVESPIGCGIVFKLTPGSAGWTENILARFHGTPNDTPYNDLLMDSLGNLYGAASGYGTFTDGSIYEVTK